VDPVSDEERRRRLAAGTVASHQRRQVKPLIATLGLALETKPLLS
jgi:hypothetical protein